MKKINYGMIGGGEGAFIGAVHRMAAALTKQTSRALRTTPAAWPYIEAVVASSRENAKYLKVER